MSKAFIEVKNVTRSFDEGNIQALRGVNVVIAKDEFIAIMGPSGCGKSTLLNMIGALDSPTSGDVVVGGVSLSSYGDLSDYRAKKVGYIFQLHNLIPSLTALENVQVPMLGVEKDQMQRVKKAEELLRLVGLKERGHIAPTRLSGGERQKVAIARALANDPEIIIADEPTGSLDSVSNKNVMQLLKNIHEERDVTIVLVTHDPQVATWADRIVHMLDGKIVS